MKDLTEKFGLRIIQDTVNVISYLKKRGGIDSIEQFLLDSIDKYRTELKQKDITIYKSQVPKCPECGGPLKIRSLLVENKFKYNSHWYCVNDSVNCAHERYSTKTIVQELKAVGIVQPRIRR